MLKNSDNIFFMIFFYTEIKFKAWGKVNSSYNQSDKSYLKW